MNLNKSTLIIYSLLGIIAMLTGMLIGQYETYQSKLAWWRQFGRGCSMVSQKQDRLIRSLLR